MTLTEAIATETRRYVTMCRDAAACAERGTDHAPEECRYRRRARIHYLALRRLRHALVTDHEAVCHQTPTVHAYGSVPVPGVAL